MTRRVMYQCDRCGATAGEELGDWGQIETVKGARPPDTKAQWDLCPPCCRVLQGVLIPEPRMPEHVNMGKLEGGST